MLPWGAVLLESEPFQKHVVLPAEVFAAEHPCHTVRKTAFDLPPGEPRLENRDPAEKVLQKFSHGRHLTSLNSVKFFFHRACLQTRNLIF